LKVELVRVTQNLDVIPPVAVLPSVVGYVTLPSVLVVLPRHNVPIVVGSAGKERLPTEVSPCLNRIVQARLSRVDVPIGVAA
jgi:hypothetical protein